MNKNKGLKYEDAIRAKYATAGKLEKKVLLNEFCELLGYHRKAAIRKLNSPRIKAYKQKPGRRSKYDYPELVEVIKKLWGETDYMCSKNFKVAIPQWLPFYEHAYGVINTEVRQDLLKISPSSIDRLLRSHKAKYGKGYGLTRPGTLLREQIPIRTDFFDVSKPGFVEADTVAHCGNSIAGNFVYSLTITDIFSHWTECRATWNKGATGVIEQIKDVEQNLPFEILGFDSDNGTEFLNAHLLNYFLGRKKVIPFTRSRPYHKNDNAHVEQKNWMHPRQLLGYERIDNNQIVEHLNHIYKNIWSPLRNFFFPVRKLSHKVKILSRYKRIYDDPKTPYQRLLDSPDIPQDRKDALKNTYCTLNPIMLNKQLKASLKQIRPLLRHAQVTGLSN